MSDVSRSNNPNCPHQAYPSPFLFSSNLFSSRFIPRVRSGTGNGGRPTFRDDLVGPVESQVQTSGKGDGVDGGAPLVPSSASHAGRLLGRPPLVVAVDVCPHEVQPRARTTPGREEGSVRHGSRGCEEGGGSRRVLGPEIDLIDVFGKSLS